MNIFLTRLILIEVVVVFVIGLVVVDTVGHRKLTLKFGQNWVNNKQCIVVVVIVLVLLLLLLMLLFFHCFSFVVVLDPETEL